MQRIIYLENNNIFGNVLRDEFFYLEEGIYNDYNPIDTNTKWDF